MKKTTTAKKIRSYKPVAESIDTKLTNTRLKKIQHVTNTSTDRYLQRRFTKFSEIIQCNGHYAVQGHSRSPILVPIESSYDFFLVINTSYLAPFTSYGWLDPCTVHRQPPRRNFMSCAAPPPNYLWLSQIPAENGNFIRQPNIFRCRNRINYFISKSKQCWILEWSGVT